MKRFITVLSGLLVLPAFAEVAPVYYDEIVEYTDDAIDAIETAESTAKKPVAQTASKRTTRTGATGNTVAGSRANASRTTSPRGTAATTSRGTVSRAAATRNIASRVPQTSAARSTVSARGTANRKPVTARASVTGSPMAGVRAVSAASTQNTITDSGETYRAASVQRRSSVARISTTSSTPTLTSEDVSSTTSNLTAIAELTDYCKAQYAACMDNYCNVLDENQGRCSCSKNIETYAATEAKLLEQKEQFQEVVQRIKYIGLSTEQINTLFDETQAEVAMSNHKMDDNSGDGTTLSKDLAAIRKALKEVSPQKSKSTWDTDNSGSISGMLSVDGLGSTEFELDVGSLFGGNSTDAQTTSIANRRGKQLYDTATKRCKTAVLNSCAEQGIDPNVISNAYDLEIDKQCYAYERSLNDEIKSVKSQARNAITILQQARLMLSQNKNSYDVRGCVAAIDACMQDEYVCGADYELCLDPTSKYIANGEIVKGGTPGVSGGQVANKEAISYSAINTWKSGGMYELYSSWNYDTESSKVNIPAESTNNTTVGNPWSGGSSEHLADYIDAAVTDWKDNTTSTKATNDMATYLLRKLGYIDSDNKVHGMCASIMQQCQNYTFVTNKNKDTSTFKPDNEVIRQYLAAALTKIKAKQDEVLADYAEDCRSDVTSCLSSNGYDESKKTSTASKTAINACRQEIATCMSVSGYKPADSLTLSLRSMQDWVDSMLISCPVNTYITDDTSKLVAGTSGNADTTTAVKCESCPQATLRKVTSTGEQVGSDIENGITLVSVGGMVTYCSCPDGYEQAQTDATTGMPQVCQIVVSDTQQNSGSENSGD